MIFPLLNDTSHFCIRYDLIGQYGLHGWFPSKAFLLNKLVDMKMIILRIINDHNVFRRRSGRERGNRRVRQQDRAQDGRNQEKTNGIEEDRWRDCQEGPF